MNLASCSFSQFMSIGLGLVTAGCSSAPTSGPKTREDIVEATSFWRPHLLYLKKSPHDRLHVEVDAVQGSEPDASQMDKLREFLSTHCQKPDGIQIVRDDVIPIEDAKGLPHSALARQHIDGPPNSSDGSRTAYLYVLFFDGALGDKTAELKPKDQRERNANPHVDFLPYPAAMFINTRYGGLSRRFIGDDLVLHETGHLLGLSRRPEGTTVHHCLNSECLMHAQLFIRIRRLLLGQDPVTQHRLCDDCVAEMASSKKQPSSSKLRFVGPVLVRSEQGYHVLSLPGHIKLLVGTLTDQACHDYADQVRKQAQTADGKKHVTLKTGMGKITGRGFPAVRSLGCLGSVG